VNRRPVMHPRQQLSNRPMRYELERQRADELRPGGTGKLDAVAGLAGETIERRDRLNVMGARHR